MYLITPKVLALLAILILTQHTYAQPSGIIHTTKAYKQYVLYNSALALIDLKQYITDVAIQLPYATTHNFTGTNLYGKANTTYLVRNAAIALRNVQQQLQQYNIGILIYDAYRPYSATKLMWNIIHDERYVANPNSGSNHNRGLSVDLTLVSLATKQPLLMGTAFDNFTDTAHHNFTGLPQQVLDNRKLLKTTMELYGYKPLATEWWHYTYTDTVPHAVIDLSFKQLTKLVK